MGAWKNGQFSDFCKLSNAVWLVVGSENTKTIQRYITDKTENYTAFVDIPPKIDKMSKCIEIIAQNEFEGIFDPMSFVSYIDPASEQKEQKIKLSVSYAIRCAVDLISFLCAKTIKESHIENGHHIVAAVNEELKCRANEWSASIANALVDDNNAKIDNIKQFSKTISNQISKEISMINPMCVSEFVNDALFYIEKTANQIQTLKINNITSQITFYDDDGVENTQDDIIFEMMFLFDTLINSIWTTSSCYIYDISKLHIANKNSMSKWLLMAIIENIKTNSDILICRTNIADPATNMLLEQATDLIVTKDTNPETIDWIDFWCDDIDIANDFYNVNGDFLHYSLKSQV
jgi:hypothetical protein